MRKKHTFIWLFVIIVVAVSLQFLILGENSKNGILLTNSLDLSWQTDSVERFIHGFIAGRDYIFTYGPLSQLLYSLPALLFHQPSYIAVLYAPILLTIVNTLLIFTMGIFITKKRGTSLILTTFLIFIIGLIAYDQNSLFRILLPFIYGLLLFHFVSLKKSFSLKTICILSLPSLFGLYTFDLFILGLLTTLFFICYELYTLNKNKILKFNFKKYQLLGVMHILLVIIFAILGSILLTGNLNYLIYSFDTVKNYQFVMSIPWSLNKHFLLLFFPLSLCILLLFILKDKKIHKHSKKIIFSLTIIALLQLKSSFIRSDDGHIIMGIYPSIIVIFIAFFFVLQKKLKLILVIIFFSLYLFIPQKNNIFSYISFQSFTSAINLVTNNKSFFSVYALPKSYYYDSQDFKVFENIIKKNPGNVMVYPYDSYILNIYHQTYNTFALQFYQYSNSAVEKKSVEQLQKSPPKFIILGIDDKGAIRLDNIPNFSRNPLLAKWMLANYAIEKKTENYFILRFDPYKQTNPKTTTCFTYDVDTSQIMQTNLFEKIFKSSTYYLNKDTEIRLPYMPNTKKLLLVEQFNNPTILQILFETKNNFTKYNVEKKELNIIKKYPFPKLQQNMKKQYAIKCY